MKLTIIVDDNTVYINEVCNGALALAECNIPNNVHALQWKDVKGWIEFKDNDDGTKPSNEVITELPTWATACVTAFENYVPPSVITPVPFEQSPQIPVTVV